MICTNAKCRKKIDAPLELYDGRWACPHCQKEINAATDFAITPESSELFVLSERYYFKWLTGNPRNRIAEWNNTIGMAVDLCKKAAMLGDPRAITRLGYYYDKDYVEIERSEAERCRIAFLYYSSVCYATTGGGIDAESWKSIREYAATLMLEMLAYAPVELMQEEKYRFEYNCEKIKNKLGITFDKGNYKAPTIGRVERFLGTLHSCFSPVRAPLFGIFRLSGKELCDAFEVSAKKQGSEETKSISTLIKDGLKLCYVKTKEISEDGEFVRLSGDRHISQSLNKLKEENPAVHVFFFNRCGKHRFFNRSELRHIDDLLSARGYALVTKLLDVRKDRDYTIFDDDVYFHKSVSVGKALEKLIDTMISGGK